MESLSEASPLRARPRPSYTEPTYSNISDPEDSEEEEDAGKTADAQQADPATRQATRTEHKPTANSVTLSNPNPSLSNSCCSKGAVSEDVVDNGKYVNNKKQRVTAVYSRGKEARKSGLKFIAWNCQGFNAHYKLDAVLQWEYDALVLSETKDWSKLTLPQNWITSELPTDDDPSGGVILAMSYRLSRRIK